MNYSPKITKRKAKKNTVGLKTVENVEPTNPICNCLTFEMSFLFVPWRLTLAGLKLTGTNSKPHDYKQKYKK